MGSAPALPNEVKRKQQRNRNVQWEHVLVVLGLVTCDVEGGFCSHCCCGPGCGSGSAREERHGRGIPNQLVPEHCKRQSMGPLELRLHRIATGNKEKKSAKQRLAGASGTHHDSWSLKRKFTRVCIQVEIRIQTPRIETLFRGTV